MGAILRVNLAVVERRLGEIKPDPRNPRMHSAGQVAKIAASITAFGFNNPILVDADGVVVAGEGRLRAARELGLAVAPVIVLGHLTPGQRRGFQLADNRIALDAGWDEELLASVLRDLEEIDFDLALTGFSAGELEGFVALSLEAIAVGLPDLASGERQPFQKMTFVLHDRQAEMVGMALARAKAEGRFGVELNRNVNGNALARVCEGYLGG